MQDTGSSEANFRSCASSLFHLFCVGTWLLGILWHHSNEMGVTWAWIPMFHELVCRTGKRSSQVHGWWDKTSLEPVLPGFLFFILWFSSLYIKFKVLYVTSLEIASHSHPVINILGSSKSSFIFSVRWLQYLSVVF